ncbi:hypothetical protein Bca101_092335 [Brassica carinata]
MRDRDHLHKVALSLSLLCSSIFNERRSKMEYEQAQPYIDHDEEITQEDAWTVISAYFVEQIDSSDIVDESSDIEIQPESQHNPSHQSDFAEVL